MLTFISVSDSACSICLPAFVGGYVKKCKGSLRRGNRTWQTRWQTDVAETGHGVCCDLRSVCSFSFSHLEWHMFRITNHAKLPLNMACSSASLDHQSKSIFTASRCRQAGGIGTFELLPPNVDVHYWERCGTKNTRTMESNLTESRTTEMCSLSWHLKPIKLTGKA